MFTIELCQEEAQLGSEVRASKVGDDNSVSVWEKQDDLPAATRPSFRGCPMHLHDCWQKVAVVEVCAFLLRKSPIHGLKFILH